jgi:endonuclease/exonuclease/phosphatase family metal-dependent hydrolase
MKIISWNIMQGGLSRFEGQIQLLVNRNVDVIALQEITNRGVNLYKDTLKSKGYKYLIDSFSLSVEKELLTGARKYGELIASRWPLTFLPPTEFDVPWKERVLSANINSPYGMVEFHTTHIPPGCTNEWIKIETLEGIYKRLAINAGKYRVLCGDFNTPEEEKVDGTILTCAEIITPKGIKPIGNWGDRWSKGEKSILIGLANFDLADAFRYKNGYRKLGYSWCVKRKEKSILKRFDHIFASKKLNTVNCRYIYSSRKDNLSDHSPIEAEFAPV